MALAFFFEVIKVFSTFVSKLLNFLELNKANLSHTKKKIHLDQLKYRLKCSVTVSYFTFPSLIKILLREFNFPIPDANRIQGFLFSHYSEKFLWREFYLPLPDGNYIWVILPSHPSEKPFKENFTSPFLIEIVFEKFQLFNTGENRFLGRIFPSHS